MPSVLEAAFQGSRSASDAMLDGVMALPQAIGSVLNLGLVRDGEILRLTAVKEKETNTTSM